MDFKVTIPEDCIPMEDFIRLVSSAENVKDVYLTCYQEDNPVYVIRDLDGLCTIVLHPMKDKSRDVIKLEIVGKKLCTCYNGEYQPFDKIEDLREDMMADALLGKKPFEEDYCIWSRDIRVLE